MVGHGHNILWPGFQPAFGRERRKPVSRPINGDEAGADVAAYGVEAAAVDAAARHAVEQEDDGVGRVSGAVCCEAEGARVRQSNSLTFFWPQSEFFGVRWG